MITFKQFLRDDVFAKDGDLKMAVNGPGKPRASEPGNISTNLPNKVRATTSNTGGVPVYYAFSYVPDEHTTDLLSSIKGRGPFTVDDLRRHKFLEETASYIAKYLKDLAPDVITAPKSSSNLLHEFAEILARKLGIENVHLAAYHKKEHAPLPEDRDKAMAYIKAHFIDHAMLDAKYNGDERDAFESEIAKGLYYKLKGGGVLDAKRVHKPHAKFVKGYYDVGDLDDTLDGKNVLVVDDVQSSGSTMNDVFRIAKDLGAAKVFGAVIFSRTTSK